LSYRGVVPPKEVTSVLSGYDALLLPTYHDGEGYPGVVLEAFGVGIPVICTRWRALPEIVDETCGLLVEPRDSESLLEAMTKLVSDPELHARLCKGAAARAERFSSAHWSERFIEYCREAAGRPCSRDDEARGGATIAFVGDVHTGDVSPPELGREVAGLLAAADLVVANQESPITDLPLRTEDTIGLRSAAAAAEALAGWGVDAVSLGNNHIFDCGVEGYEQTRDLLDAAGIHSFGAGHDLAGALEPLEVSLNGVRVRLLSFVEEGTRAILAGESSAGCAPLTEELAVERVRACAEEADAVVVVAHWGYCDYRTPSPDQARLVEALFRAGATAVIGHHSHVVQGVRRRSGRLVAYSLGNFAFAEYTHGGRTVNLSPDNLGGAVLRVRIDRNSVTGCVIDPTRIARGAITLDRSREREVEFVRRCRLLLPGRLESNWKRVVALRLAARVLHWANPANWSRIGRAQIVGGRIMLREMIARRR
jgi:poly-gamma-glutamate synthesis protein (capsule biosynthesis protein)